MERSHNFNNGKRSPEVSPTLKCYKCNRPDHIKAHCPTNESWTEKNEKKSHEERRSKKTYIAWDDNDSSDGLEKEINLLSKDYESDENITQED